MIGNDVVDLQLAKKQSNWQRKGFLAKQFTVFEQKEILNSSNPFLKVWLFWSMKEAAYKCYSQHYQKRFFAPSQFSCKIINIDTAIVKYNAKKYDIKYLITDNYVYSFAQSESFKKMVSEVFYIDKNELQGQKKYQKLLSHFDADAYIKKNELGIPYVYQQTQKLPVSISFSHHGNYGAFAFSYL